MLAEVTLPGGGMRIALTFEQLCELQESVNCAIGLVLGHIDPPSLY